MLSGPGWLTHKLVLINIRLITTGRVSVAYSLEDGLSLELLFGINAFVNQGKTGTPATSILDLHTEYRNCVFFRLQQCGELGLDSGFGDVSLLGVDQLNNLRRGQRGGRGHLRIVFSPSEGF